MQVTFRKVKPKDVLPLKQYFDNLSSTTKSRFGPHPFDLQTTEAICKQEYSSYQAFICLDKSNIIAYAVVFKGYTEGERYRFKQYSIKPNQEKDYTLAPSVADAYQSKGIGTSLFDYIEAELRKQGAEKIVLWGGVQLTNQRAVRFYLKHGFRTLGEFDHNGLDNLDMVKYLND
jgi:GNAT superfamily N-acetyltransferase